VAAAARLGLGATALAAMMVSGGLSAAASYRDVNYAAVRGAEVEGLVVAAKLPGKPRARVHISLHDVPLNSSGKTRYLITADRRPCSQLAGDFDSDGVVDGADFLVWRTNIIMANTEGDFMRRKNASLKGRLDSARSVRVYDLMTPQARQRACGAVHTEGAS
jgi:hypothetical protein